jgi:LmbE family N-acetylglucosaminyl deacetylase
MLGTTPVWIERTIKLSSGQFIYLVQPKGNQKLSLIYLRLPDGNVRGEGFGSTNRQILQKLYNGQASSLDAIYGNSTFNRQELVSALSTLMNTYKPSEVRTQSTFVGKKIPDHSDHATTSRFVELAFKDYTALPTTLNSPSLKHYIGNPIHTMNENLTPAELDLMSRTFFSYAKHDPAVCQSPEDCSRGSVYNFYLRRMYRNEY